MKWQDVTSGDALSIHILSISRFTSVSRNCVHEFVAVFHYIVMVGM
jgi:hypothetical protein